MKFKKEKAVNSRWLSWYRNGRGGSVKRPVQPWAACTVGARMPAALED